MGGGGFRSLGGEGGPGLTQALVGVFGRSSPPGAVVVEGLAHLAVVTLCVVLAVAHRLAVLVPRTLTGVAIALAPGDMERGGGNSVISYRSRRAVHEPSVLMLIG